MSIETVVYPKNRYKSIISSQILSKTFYKGTFTKTKTVGLGGNLFLAEVNGMAPFTTE